MYYAPPTDSQIHYSPLVYYWREGSKQMTSAGVFFGVGWCGEEWGWVQSMLNQSDTADVM